MKKQQTDFKKYIYNILFYNISNLGILVIVIIKITLIIKTIVHFVTEQMNNDNKLEQ